MKRGWARKPPESEDEVSYELKFKNEEIEEIVHTMPLSNFIEKQYLRYIAHVCRSPNTALTKKLLFAKASRPYYRDARIRIANLLHMSIDQAKASTQSRSGFNEMLCHIYGEETRFLDDKSLDGGTISVSVVNQGHYSLRITEDTKDN